MILRRSWRACVAFAAAWLFQGALLAAEPLPEELKNVGVEEHLGTQLNLDLPFVNQDGVVVRLQDFFADGKPVLLTLNYYGCTMLCNFQLNGLVDALKEMKWKAGKEFRVVTVSFDPRDDSVLAKGKRATYLQSLGQPDADWSFLTGSQVSIEALAKAVGFEYQAVAQGGGGKEEFAHPAVLYVLSPTGKMSRYLYGIEFSPQELKFALMDAAEGKVGTTIDKILLSCFHYDPKAGRYTPFAVGLMRVAGGATAALLAGSILMMGVQRARRV